MKSDIKAIYDLIGPALIIIWNPKSITLEIISDHFGYYPAFTYRNDRNEIKIISSSPDAIANDQNVNVTTDELSFVEFLSAWRITPPHTYYNEIKYLGAAKHFKINFTDHRIDEKEYWVPFNHGFYDNFEIASTELESALRDSISKITLPDLGPIVILQVVVWIPVLYYIVQLIEMKLLDLIYMIYRTWNLKSRSSCAKNAMLRYFGFAT